MLTMGRRRFRSLQRMVAPVQQPPSPQEEGTGGSRRGAGSQAPPHGTWSKAFFGGRPSAGEVPQGLPPAEARGRGGNRWRPLYPIGVVLGFRSPSVVVECGARRGPHLAI